MASKPAGSESARVGRIANPSYKTVNQPCETGTSPHGPVQEPQLARAAAGSLQEGQPTISDAVSHLLEEFPSGRSAVLLLCDPEPVAVAPALAALGVDLASRVTGQLLVIDATNRVSELANLLTVEPASSHESRPGLADVLAGNATWQQAVRRTRLPNLEMLSGGKEETAPDKPSLPMTNDGWAAVLRQLRQQYQFVLIGVSPGDSPAVTAIARAADAIYLVLRPGHTGHRAARNAVRTLHRCGGRVLGCLLVEHCTTGLDKQDG